jgi:acyl carrier protein
MPNNNITQVHECIVRILRQQRPEINFEESIDLISDGIIDSFEIIMLVTEFEKVFGVNISGDEIVPESFVTVSAMTALISRLQKEV